MAARKTLKFLPTIFQTDVNSKFLSATVDQLISEPNLKTVHGYIGRKFAPTYKTKDSYVIENNADRQNYQLEPSIVVRDDQQNITFFSSYIDLLNKIEYYGGIIDDHSRLFSNEYYSFDPRISYDKFVNFTQYFWLPDGPDPVDVYTGGVELEKTFTVTRNDATGVYQFTSGGVVNNTITLARGGIYRFEIDQASAPFWIQTELGIDGKFNATPNISTREVLGVANNGADTGTVTFYVPQSDAQNRFTAMTTVYTVDYAVPLAYSNLHNQLLSKFLETYPQYAGIAGTLDGKVLIFVDQENLTNYGEEAWTAGGVFDLDGLQVNGFDAGTVVPEAQRFGVWRVQFVNGGEGDPVIKLVPVINVNLNQKVYIRYGVANANKEYYKDVDGFFHQMPILSSIQDTLYYQDGIDPAIYGQIKIVEPSGWQIDVNADILGKKTYTSPNGIRFTSGLKIKFDVDVTPASYQNKEFYVEGVGDTIRLVAVDLLVTPEAYNQELAVNYPGQSFPEYITINRASCDLNAWSRNNRWFHRDVITATANYNSTVPQFDQALRAQRPIIQFGTDLQLYNYGRIGKAHIDILDTDTVDAFNEIEGQAYTTLFGVDVIDGIRVLFANDADPLVRDKIYVINLVYIHSDIDGTPTGTPQIKLTIADDGNAEPYDSVVVLAGQYKGSQWWYNGTQWNASQQKTALQQEPLFDIVDASTVSYSALPASSFTGTKLFGYKTNTAGTNDSVLGFPLSYRNFGTQGDIEFTNYFDIDTFTYTNNATNLQQTEKIASGFIAKIVDRLNLAKSNIWQTVIEPSRQYQILSYFATGTSSTFKLDITPKAESSIPYLKVFKNNALQPAASWTFNSTNKEVTLTTTPVLNDKIDVLVYSREISKIGHYQIPLNLDLNAQNTDLTSLTLGQLRNHLVELSHNSKDLTGNVLGPSNLRDIELTNQGGDILQHSAPVSHAALFLLDENANFINAIRLAQQEYSRFKNKFLEYSITLNGITPTDPVASVDLILTEINKIKSQQFPWYYSDMVPYGPLKNIVADVGYTVFDPTVRAYEITNVFSTTTLSNQAVLVYLNGEQLILDRDYSFNTDRPAITIDDRVTLTIDDIITIIEYSNTDGNYIPETPTKLGLYPKFIPEVFEDNTYRNTINVIRGHDGSITPAFNDYRDEFLLELEKRIYNNIKLSDLGSYRDIYEVVPGKFRNSDYNITESTKLLSKSFLTWVGNNKLDYSVNDVFDSNDAFTWNYSKFVDRIDGEYLPGNWRACYQYFYDTDAPHQHPWEMLGFATLPSWWEEFYGAAPYTGGNKLLWDDLELGTIRQGSRSQGQKYTTWDLTVAYTKGQYVTYDGLFYLAKYTINAGSDFNYADWYQVNQVDIPWEPGYDLQFARPGLSAIIPVDDNGNLKSPAAVLAAEFDSKYAATSWAVGHQGPVETAWRRSSDFTYAIQVALALAKPGKYFGLFSNINKYSKNYELNQYLTANNNHIQQTELTFNGDVSTGTVVRTAGYLNWIADYLTNLGINPAAKITPMLTNYSVNLAYKMSGFSDQKYLQVLAEQSSPTSTNDSIIIPNENYSVHLYKSTPVSQAVYSAVIVEKTTNGYSVRGYNLTDPYFTIIPSMVNGNLSKIKVVNLEAVIYKDYQPVKLTIPYGYEFKNQQQLVDFLISYERFLQAQGFTFNDFDQQLGEIRNWKLSSKEFLFWSQQGWTTGSILVLSPIANTVKLITSGAIADEVSDSQYGSKVVDQNFKLVKNVNYNINRTPTLFSIDLTNGQIIGFLAIDLVQYEHVLVFDNTTVFNDIIYKPELGNRQYRLKLVGQKTADWDGSLSAPGFIYNSGVVQLWVAGKDYLKGELVQYKNQYYVALNNIVASELFDFSKWKTADYSQIKKGLLPNLSSLAVKAQSYYDAYGYFNDSADVKYSHGLIGFKPRTYLDDLGLNETTQVEFYKGYITQKGTANAVDALTNAQFNNLNSAIQYYEEWAIRVGEYGALDINPYLEIVLDEKAFGVNPALAEFVSYDEVARADGVNTFANINLYKSSGQFTGSIASNRTSYSDYENDVPTAGYVNIDDVDATIYDLADYRALDSLLYSIGSGYTIWCAKDFQRNWNVFRLTETDVHIQEVENSLDNYITFRTDVFHGLSVNDVVMIRNFDIYFDGFYQVYKVVNLTKFMVRFVGDLTDFNAQDGDGILFNLDSLRFQYMENAREYFPPHGWINGEKIWIDDDAETNAVQGQPFGTQPNNTWKVYEKTFPWELQETIAKPTNEYQANSNFGGAVKMSDDTQTIAVGAPAYSNVLVSTNIGIVNVFDKNASNAYVETSTIVPDGANTYAFGSHIDIAIDTDGITERMAVNAPTSSGVSGASEVGLVYTYHKTVGSTNWTRGQVLVGNVSATGGQFGTGFAFDEFGHWLYVGAPYEAIPKVYVYGLVRNVTERTATVTTPGSVSSITAPFTPTDGNAVVITTSTRTYIQDIDYTISGTTVTFLSGNVNDTFTFTEGPYYKLVGEPLVGPAASEFGYAIDSSLDGAQLGIGAPGANVLVDGSWIESAGAVYVYDRVIEASISTTGTVYNTIEDIASVYKVTVDDVELPATGYSKTGAKQVTLNIPVGLGKIVKIEANKFTLLERLIGIDSLTGSLSAIQRGARFGTSLTICSNNCAFYIGAPYYDNGTTYNTGAVWKFHNRGRLYGTNTGYAQNPTFTAGDTIRLDNFEVIAANISTPASSVVSLDDLVTNINSAGILGVNAVNENGYLRLNSDRTLAKNLLRILSGSGTIYEDAGLIVFAYMQIIVNPYNQSGEYFGSKVILARNAYMLVISSDRGTTKRYTTFDTDSTYLDGRTTGLFDKIKGSGSAYTYELYDDPRNEVENPGRYAFCQQLDPGTLNPGDSFGAAIDVIGGYILVTAPNDDTTITNGGSVYLFNNPTGRRGWSLIRYQQPTVDIDSINRVYLYNKQTNTILTNLEFIDPAKGKILGQAEQEINYKTAYDPAIYNNGTNERATVNSEIYWGPRQINQVWWDLDQVRYIDYEQDTLTYRTINWGRLFPGSTVEVLEWVESTVLPSGYVAAGYDGTPKYSDDSAYVESIFVDEVTNTISNKYYFWVKNKTTLAAVNSVRRLPIKVVQDLIEDPKNNGTAYCAIVDTNSMIVYNVNQFLSAQDTVLHLDYETLRNSSIIHSEYELLQQGNPTNQLPTKIVNKLIDSLSGIDSAGATVPDPTLSVADSYGISIRPRQTMFTNRVAALTTMIRYVNGVFITQPISAQYDLKQMLAEEAQPNIKLNEYDLLVDTEEALLYINVSEYASGYRVLVNNNTQYENRWTLHTLSTNKTWSLTRVQSYKTNLYWDYVDWYATGYDSSIKATYAVNTLVDAKKLPYAVGNIIKVANNGSGTWQLILVNSNLDFETIGVQNGTIQLNATKLTDTTINQHVEIRYIINALKDDIFIGQLAAEYNKLFFVMINYLFGEQKYVDWIFKTSFVSVVHQLRGLIQFPNYIKDNQTYYEEYINEVKPYKTKIREYLINYNSTDEFAGSVTDFDLPPYYDVDTGIFRSPSGELITKDSQLWQTDTYNQWYQNRNYQIDSIIVEHGGSGYTGVPVVEIYGNGTGATAHAIIDYDLGTVTAIVVDKPGSGYSQTVVVRINGYGTGAAASARLINNQVRSIGTTLKFDRITDATYGTNGTVVAGWTANTYYSANTIVSYDGVGYQVTANITTGTTFLATDYTVYSANLFTNASDRIMAYYNPTSSMPVKDLNQLIYGYEYPGVQVQGLSYNQQPGFAGGTPFDIGIYDQIQYDQDGLPMVSDDAYDTIIRSNYLDSTLGLRAEDIDVDGGAYVDRYSSHAPEEMVPGIMLETLNMQVYTKISGNVAVGYRIFNRSYNTVDSSDAIKTVIVNETNYLRISDAYSTVLAADLSILDTEIKVADTTKLLTPNPIAGVPGIVFIGTERVTYWTLDAVTNTLGQIRRGTYSTGTPILHPAGTKVTDASIQQVVPGTSIGNIVSTGTPITVTNTPPYYLRVSGNIAPKFGDFITQATTGANATVIAASEYATETILLNGTTSVIVGDYITQPISGTNVRITEAGTNVSSIKVEYVSGTFTNAFGNLSLNGTVLTNWSNVYTASTTTWSNINLGLVPLGAADRNTTVVSVIYNNSNAFDFSNVAIALSGNISANVGDFITQRVDNEETANVTVMLDVSDSANVTALYNSIDTLITTGNILINGIDSNVTVTTSGANPVDLDTNLAINGNYTSTVYPYYTELHTDPNDGIDANGNVVVAAGNVLITANVWTTIASNVTAGSYEIDSSSEQILFLKQAVATYTIGIGTEDAVNILTTENNVILIEE